MKPPVNSKGVREFLGLMEYYRKFINRFADAARPLTKLTRKDSKFIWTDECQTGFEYLRTCLTESPILKYPDPHKRYVVLLMLLIKLLPQSLLKSTQIMMIR